MPSPPRLSPNVCLHHREPESPSCYREHARCRENLGRRRTDSPLDNSKAEPGWSAGGDGGGVRASNFAWDERPNHALSHKGLKPPAECSPLDPSIPTLPCLSLILESLILDVAFQEISKISTDSYVKNGYCEE